MCTSLHIRWFNESEWKNGTLHIRAINKDKWKTKSVSKVMFTLDEGKEDRLRQIQRIEIVYTANGTKRRWMFEEIYKPITYRREHCNQFQTKLH